MKMAVLAMLALGVIGGCSAPPDEQPAPSTPPVTGKGVQASPDSQQLSINPNYKPK